MSLKAKIEAVIYASEEPVTLQQLVGLLGQEAQAELDAEDALQPELPLVDIDTPAALDEAEAGDQDALNAETLGEATAEAAATAAEEPTAPEAAAATPDETPEPETSTPTSDETLEAELAEAPAPDSEAPIAETPLDADGSDVPLVDEPADAARSAPPEEPSAEAPEVPPNPAEPPLPESAEATGQPDQARTRQDARRLRDYFRSVLDSLIVEYRDSDRGLEIREVAGGFRFATKPEYHDAVRGFVRSLKPPLKLSLQALETLAVVAYKQPVTAPEVSEIRGVDSGGVLASLMTRKLVTTAGRKQVIGRPILYKTSKEFLLRFGLKDLSELPSIEEFERLASDLNEPVQEEIPMAAHPEDFKPGPPVGDAARNVEPMRDEHHAQADGTPNGDSDATGTEGPAGTEPYSEQHLTPAPDAPGEFTGDESVPPADNLIDGRMTGLPPNYDEPNSGIDSPALDAEIQAEQAGNRTGEEG